MFGEYNQQDKKSMWHVSIANKGEYMVARDGVEPPTPAFSGIL
jgi:hypothetical protein